MLYLVCTDWRVTPKASPICCHDQPLFPGRRDVVGLDPFGEPVQSESGAEPQRWVVGRDRGGDVFGVHAVSLD